MSVPCPLLVSAMLSVPYHAMQRDTHTCAKDLWCGSRVYEHMPVQGLGKTITALALVLKTRGLQPVLPDVAVTRQRDGGGRHVAFYSGELPALCYCY